MQTHKKLAEALIGVDCSIDVATGPAPAQDAATEFFTTAARKMRAQLVAARTIAEALVDLATSPESASSASPIPEIAGPREENLVDMARMLVARRGDLLRSLAGDSSQQLRSPGWPCHRYDHLAAPATSLVEENRSIGAPLGIQMPSRTPVRAGPLD